MSKPIDLIVIGAGISGLAMAHYARKAGLEVLVLEKESRAGGCIHTHAVAHGGHPFWLEMGAHTAFNSYGRLLDIIDDVGLSELLQKREKLSFRLLVDEAIRSIPSQLHWLELLVSGPRLFFSEKAGKSVAEYYGAIVGKRNYAEIFGPAFNAVICQQADGVPADMLFRKRERRKEVLRSYTFPNGMQDIVRHLRTDLHVKTGQSISSIDYRQGHFTVTTADGSYQAPKLACAAPVSAAATLLKDAFPDISAALARVREVDIESVGVVMEKQAPGLEAVAGIIAASDYFYSAVSRDVVGHAHLRGLTFHFKPGLLSQAEKLAHIAKLLGIKTDEFVDVSAKTNRLPAPDMRHHALIGMVDGLLQGQPMALVGNYFKGVAIEDCLERVEGEFRRLCPQN